MKKLEELNWFEQCVVKLEVAQEMIEILEAKEVFSVHDQVKINMILGLLKSPMEYSIGAIQSKYGKEKERSYVPIKRNGQSNEDFKKYFKSKLGTDSDEVLKLLLSVQETEGVHWHRQLHEMNNNEKHSSITLHTKMITEHIDRIVLPGNNVLIDSSFSYKEGSNSKFLVVDGKEVDLTNTKGFTRSTSLVFDNNGEDVFEFLKLSFDGVNKFIIDTYVLLEGKEPEFDIYDDF